MLAFLYFSALSCPFSPPANHPLGLVRPYETIVFLYYY